MVETAAGHFDGIDVLVNNAGIMKVAEFLDVTEEDFDANDFSAAVACGMVNCASECLDGGDACTVCLDDNGCQDDFAACSGLDG